MNTDKKNTIKICMGSSCFARGNNENLHLLEEFIEKNNLDLKVELIGSRCEDMCEKGPYIVIDDVAYENIQEDDLNKILTEKFLKH